MCGKTGARGPHVQHLAGRVSTFGLGLAVNQLLGEVTYVQEILQTPKNALYLSVQVAFFLNCRSCFHIYLAVGNTTWQEWGPWTQCTATCGLGKEFRARACNQAIPGGNETCPGDATEARNCMSGACPGKTCDHDSISISKY